MIKSFADEQTRRFWEDEKPGKWPPANLRDTIKRKLAMLDGAAKLEDLRVPPGNRLHALMGDRTGQHSIRINDQFRICFVWRDGNVYDVEITDYH
ncbi:MAG: type II toxin-antitoxin system RelE/ParE family toxin [Candidatus Korobacteraceae bacterium]